MVTYAQLDLDYGIKAGFNYNTNGKFTSTPVFVFEPNENNQTIINAESKIGYQLGVFTQLNFDLLYIRPEFLYSKTKSTYDNSDFKLATLDVPILFGYKILSPISIYLGPSIHYLYENDLNNKSFELEKDIVYGINFGVSAQVSKFGFDLRYSSNISKNTGIDSSDTVVDGPLYTIDPKSKQLILSVAFQLN